MDAGRRYGEALQTLGLRPDGLFWAWDQTIEQFVLVLVTRHVDHIGPREIFQVLTDAYEASGTPSEIAPFLVRLHSPRQQIIRKLLTVDAHDASGIRLENVDAMMSTQDLQMSNHWVYKFPPTDASSEALHKGRGRAMKMAKQNPITRNREWHRFRAAVQNLAA